MITSNIKFRYNSNDPLNGAFTYLQKEFNKEDIHEDIVKINASSTEKNLYNPIIRRDLASGTYWQSKNESRSWYEIDFLQNNFYLKSYLFRTYSWDFFEEWQVLGSNDGTNFDVVDDVTDFKEPTEERHHNILFKCKYPKMRRIFRIVANGKRFYGDYKFIIHRLEFYGMFVSSPFVQENIKKCSNKSLLSLSFLITLSCH